MKNTHYPAHPGLALGLCLLALPLPVAACVSCGCSLSSDWPSHGLANEPGWRLDLRYDWLKQAQLRSRHAPVSRDDYPAPAEREIEFATRNQLLTLGLDYSPNADWGVSLKLPVLNRDHLTRAEDDVDLSSSHSKNLGDITVEGRYQGFSAAHDRGLQFGLKLPTGRSTDVFGGGPQAGTPLDRGLQPGSGSTDLILGAYGFGAWGATLEWFAQGHLQQTLLQKDRYRPGTALSLNLGLRTGTWQTLAPEVQLNLVHRLRDQGDNADIDNSGGTTVSISPGVSAEIGRHTQLFGYLQLPIYQHLQGLQLAPYWSVSVGARYGF